MSFGVKIEKGPESLKNRETQLINYDMLLLLQQFMATSKHLDMSGWHTTAYNENLQNIASEEKNA